MKTKTIKVEIGKMSDQQTENFDSQIDDRIVDMGLNGQIYTVIYHVDVAQRTNCRYAIEIIYEKQKLVILHVYMA